MGFVMVPEDLRAEMVPTSSLVPYAGNAKRHPEWQVEQIANSIRAFGFNDPIAVWHDVAGHPVIVEGHGRLLAAKALGMEEVPVISLDHLDDEGRRAYTLAHNKLTMNTDFDALLLDSELDAIEGLDMAEFGFEVEEPLASRYEDGEAGSLAKRFVVPPFSVLDTRGAEWQARKREWKQITGDLSETRDGEYGRLGGGVIPTINGGTSNFDPVLAEVMVRWFCPEGGSILDPFAGEQTKGVVAGELGHPYTGIEIREEQVRLNLTKVGQYSGIEYVVGDSCKLLEYLGGRKYDMVLTSPPYYDLEVYSESDMSALGTYEEFMAQYRSIFAQCYEALNDDSFLVIKVGEIRGGGGAYRGFVPDTVAAMTDAGFSYYDELTLVHPAGTAPLRASGFMRTRKVVKLHQNVLVFLKGTGGGVRERFPDLSAEELGGE